MDFVVARGPALHRTAVLLTRQEQAAEDLVQIALAKAWQSWSRIDGNQDPGLASPDPGATGPAPAITPGTPVTVTIEPQGFQGPDWRVAVQPDPTTGG